MFKYKNEVGDSLLINPEAQCTKRKDFPDSLWSLTALKEDPASKELAEQPKGDRRRKPIMNRCHQKLTFKEPKRTLGN